MKMKQKDPSNCKQSLRIDVSISAQVYETNEFSFYSINEMLSDATIKKQKVRHYGFDGIKKREYK